VVVVCIVLFRIEDFRFRAGLLSVNIISVTMAPFDVASKALLIPSFSPFLTSRETVNSYSTVTCMAGGSPGQVSHETGHKSCTLLELSQ